MSSCPTCLIRKSDTPISMAMFQIDLLGSVNHGLDLTRMISEPSELRYLRNHHWTHPTLFGIFCTVFRLTPRQTEIFVIKLLVIMPSSTVCQFEISGGENCVRVLLSSQTASQLTSLHHSRQKPEQTKHVCM